MAQVELNRITLPNIAPVAKPEADAELSFILKIQQLVYRILDLLSKTSEADHAKVQNLKREYSEGSFNSAKLQTKMGNAAPWFAVASFALSFLQFAVPNQLGQNCAKIFSEQVPSATASLYNSRLQADQMNENARSSRANTDLNLQQSKQSGEAGQKQEVLQLLNAVLKTLEDASRG